MIRFIWSQLRGRGGRSVALLAGVLVATTGFTVLTGATATSRLQVTGTLDANARGAYDILVRPKGAQSPIETQQSLVRPDSLSGTYGGITLDQVQRISGLAGVDVAAPIAMAGSVNLEVYNWFDITSLVDFSLDEQVIRVDPTFNSDRGLSHATAKPSYVYLTKHPLTWVDFSQSTGSHTRFRDGEYLNNDVLCGGMVAALDLSTPEHRPLCEDFFTGGLGPDTEAAEVTIIGLNPDHTFSSNSAAGESRTKTLEAGVRSNLPMTVAAIDPAAEAKLFGLDHAVTLGRYLNLSDKTGDKAHDNGAVQTVPVLASSHSYFDATTEVSFARLAPGTSVLGVGQPALASTLDKAAVAAQLGRQHVNAEQYLQKRLTDSVNNPAQGVMFGNLVQVGAPEYQRRGDGGLVARAVPNNAFAYDRDNIGGYTYPWLTDDVSFRTLSPIAPTAPESVYASRVVGMYDPAKVTGFDALNQMALETYRPPGVTGGDDRSRQLLGNQPLLPDSNAAGYLATPPLMLTTLDALPHLTRRSEQAPVSAVRVRVKDVTGFSKASRERVRLVAEQVATETGLDVDIVYGSSMAPQAVELPVGKFGRPALTLTEGWSKKGVAAAIVSAVDRKSAVLFLLVLIVCALFLLNAVTAAVRDRRAELAVLSCLGWPGRRIGFAILAEVLAIGAVAGVLALAVAAPLGWLFHVRLSWWHALLALPIALGLTLLSGLVPAIRAARAHPAGALRPPVTRRRRPRSPRTVLGLAWANLARVPGRTLLGATALAIGIAALTLVAAITFAFRGAVVGTLLGDAVAMRVRGVDTVAVAATVLLGAFAVADVLYLNIRERADELASLRAAGWTDGALGRLVTYEGLVIGVIGALVGAGVGLGGAALMVGAAPAELIVTGGATALAGVAVAGLSALVPAALLRRMPIARLLAEE
jgi:putative ABC transport system permease protein